MSEPHDTDMPGLHGSEHELISGPLNHDHVCDMSWRMLPPLAYEQPVAPRQLLDQTPHPQQGCSPPGLGPGFQQRQGCDLTELEADAPYHAHKVRTGSPRATMREGKQQTGTFLDPEALDLSLHHHDEAQRKGRSPIRRRSERSSLGKRRRRRGSTPKARRNASKNGAPDFSARPRINPPSRALHVLILSDFRSFWVQLRNEMQKDGFPERSSNEYVQHAHRLQITDARKSPGGYPRFEGNSRPACVPWTSGEESHLRNMICFLQSSVWYRVQENMPCHGFPPRAISEYMRQYDSALCSNGDAEFGCSFVDETQGTQQPPFS